MLRWDIKALALILNYSNLRLPPGRKPGSWPKHMACRYLKTTSKIASIHTAIGCINEVPVPPVRVVGCSPTPRRIIALTAIALGKYQLRVYAAPIVALVRALVSNAQERN